MTPEEALAFAKSVSDIYAESASALGAVIGRSVAAGMGNPDWAEQQLTQILRLRREAQKVVARMQSAGAAEIQQIVEQVYMTQAAPGGGITRVNTRTVAALAAETTARVQTLGPPLLRQVEDTFRQVISEAVSASATGSESRQAAAARALERFAARGIGSFTDTNGRRWSIEAYAEMATRTALGRAHLAGTLHQYRQLGTEYVTVSDSPEECHQCRPYEGTLLSLGDDRPPPDTGGFTYKGTLAAAQAGGLFHPNCTHRVNRWIAGLSRPIPRETANPEGYELRQQQRTHERRVRDSKRRVAALRPLGDTPALRRQERLLKNRQGALDRFVAENGRKAGVSARRTNIGRLPKRPTFTPPTPQPTPGQPPKAGQFKTLSDLPRKQQPGTIADDVAGTNPKFGAKTEYTVNCQRCVNAFELRQRGYDVTAAPNNGTGNAGSPSVYGSWIDGAYDRFNASYRTLLPKGRKAGPNDVDQFGLRPIEDPEDYVRSVVAGWPVGSRGFVRFSRSRGAGHVFNVLHTPDGVLFVDAQSGDVTGAGVARYWSQVARSRFGSVGVARVDDLPLTEAILEAVEGGSSGSP